MQRLERKKNGSQVGITCPFPEMVLNATRCTEDVCVRLYTDPFRDN